jgi:DNA-binding CsgD family transcriptional regulator
MAAHRPGIKEMLAMSLSERALSLIGAVYEAGREPRGWRTAIDRSVATVGATGGGLQLHGTKSLEPMFCEQVGLSRESIDDYVAGFMRDNPVVKASHALPVGVPVLDWMATPKRTLMGTPIYQEWGRRNGVHGGAYIVLARDRSQFASFNLIRSHELGDFERSELKLLNAVAPHLQRAVEMNRLLAKLDRERYEAYAVLERLEIAVLFVGIDGFVVHMNAAAAGLIAAKDGLQLFRNRLQAAGGEPSKEMARHIHDAAMHEGSRGGTIVLPRPSGRRPLIVRIYPLSARGPFLPPDGAQVAVFVTDPELRPQEPVAHVARAYGLTKAETRLLARLIDSPTLLDAAETLAITEATARTLLGRIFAKTGTQRQAELMRLVLTMRPPVLPN